MTDRQAPSTGKSLKPTEQDKTSPKASCATTTRISSPRRRATKACMKCRGRKVRCDVTVNGYPCTNCRLDGFSCKVLPHSRHLLRERLFAKKKPQVVVQGDKEADNVPTNGPTASKVNAITEFGLELDLGPELDWAIDGSDSSNRGQAPYSTRPSDKTPTIGRYGCFWERSSKYAANIYDQSIRDSIDLGGQHWCEIEPPDAWRACSQNDLHMLRASKCFSLPKPPILAQYLKHYLLHIHHMLPMLDNATIHTLSQMDRADVTLWQDKPTQFLVLQSILFAASAYIPDEYCHELQFKSARHARATFYTKAKLLYKHARIVDHLNMAQAALLLTYWCPAFSLDKSKPNSSWLHKAIYHARAIKAPEHARGTNSSDTDRFLGDAKRIWWCCIIRDRIMSLCMRRQMQIPMSESMLNPSDILSIRTQSSIITKFLNLSFLVDGVLSHVLVLFAELCQCLSGVLELVYGHWEQPTSGDQTRKNLRLQIKNSKLTLQSWFDEAQVRIDSLGIEKAEPTKNEKNIINISLNVIWIYYYSARLALFNYEMRLSLEALSHTQSSEGVLDHKELYGIMESLVSCLSSILDSSFSHSLPSSVVGCSAFPLALHMLILKTRASHRQPEDSRIAKMMRQLEVLQQTMKNCHPVYDGVDLVNKTIEYFMNCTYLDENEEGRMIPIHYLRMALTIDLSLREDRLPEEDDFPQDTRSLIRQGGCFMPILFENCKSTAELEGRSELATGEHEHGSSDEEMAMPLSLDRWIENDRSLFFAYEMGLGP